MNHLKPEADESFTRNNKIKRCGREGNIIILHRCARRREKTRGVRGKRIKTAMRVSGVETCEDKSMYIDSSLDDFFFILYLNI